MKNCSSPVGDTLERLLAKQGRPFLNSATSSLCLQQNCVEFSVLKGAEIQEIYWNSHTSSRLQFHLNSYENLYKDNENVDKFTISHSSIREVEVEKFLPKYIYFIVLQNYQKGEIAKFSISSTFGLLKGTG